MTAPLAARRPHTATHHGITLEDPYAWLKDPAYPQVTDPDILAHLAAENAHFEAWLAPRAPLVDTLFAEMRARIKEDDASVPVRNGDWLYWWAYETGGQYRRWFRKPAGGGEDALILDEPALAAGHEYFRLGGLAVSPDGARLAYAIDDNGSERFTLRVRDLASGTDGPVISTETMGSPVWQADSASLAYVEVNAEWRPWRVRLHRLPISSRHPGLEPGPTFSAGPMREGEDGGSRVEPGMTTELDEDVILYEEPDASFFVGIGRTQDRQWLTIVSADHVTSEVRLAPIADLAAPPKLVSRRQAGRMYDVDSGQGKLFIRVNDTHLNFRVCTADPVRPADWRELIAGTDEVYIRDLTAFADWLVLGERVGGLDQVRVRLPDGSEHRVALPEASYTVSLGENPEYAPDMLRLHYQSMVTPPTVFDYDPAARALTTRKVQTIPSGYDPALYETQRLHIPARDGTPIPVSLVRRKDAAPGKLHLYGYGAYGLAIPPGFSTSRLSLVDRGVAYAIAHIRGGDDLGYAWYLDGKLEKRANTYTDFIDVARGLAALGHAAEGDISASGGSAGGNLMGVVVNDAPDLWRAVVAHVPFVDMLNTMLDASLPLTPIEWPEWGDPITDEAAFRRILSFSPYENVRAQAYPPLLVTAGLNDPRVTYWEPAKWVARLRATRTNDAPLLLKTNMGAGHGGKSGRFESLREVAEEYAFVLAAFGMAGA